MVKLATSRLPPKTGSSFVAQICWGGGGGGEGDQGMNAKLSEKYIFSSSRVLRRN